MSIPDSLLRGIGTLDPLPITAQRLIPLLQDEETPFREIVRVIEFDEAVVANILRMANSSYYGGHCRIESLQDAVSRLGTTTILNIVLGDYMRRVQIDAPMYDLTENELWLHGAAASLAVRAIQREAPEAEIPQLASIAGLLHDIGKLILSRFMKVGLEDIRAKCRADDLTFVEAEHALCGCDHAELGAALGRLWGFPDTVVVAIEQHHMSPPTDPATIVDTVVIANLIAKTIGVGLGAEGMDFRIDIRHSVDRLGIGVNGLMRACAQTAFWVEEFKESAGYRKAA
ncbi:MAG: HDOD domain-containing protein [Candidatus Eisenbacteria bacterium]|nr:HDOD domain-containing protein [Candidatus Eisenbacteria bacterium]